MAIIATDLLVINRGGVDYKAPASELPQIDVGDGYIRINDADGQTLGEFSVNQDYSSDIDLPRIGDGWITINDADGKIVAEFSVNESDDKTFTLPKVGGGWIEILDADGDTVGEFNVNQDTNTAITLPTVGDGWIEILDADGDTVGEFNVNQDKNTAITLPQVVIPEALHPKGFINVADAAPADPAHGDIYVQHQDGESSAIADASFTGLSGETIKEGTFVIFGVDDKWHAGGNANSTQVQSDWSETDQTSPAFILSKPDVYTKTESDAKYLPLNISTLPALP